MPRPTPFHPRTQALCSSYAWKHWAGYYAVCHYDESPEREYNAVRQAAGLIDVTPLFKYDLRGPDAGRFLSYVLAKPVHRLKTHRVSYVCWCDDDGNILDDGTCWRLGKEHYRLTAAEPTLWWLLRHVDAFDVQITDTSDQIAALALQGPTSRDVLKACCDADLDGLGFFALTEATFSAPAGDGGSDSNFRGTITRTGYTGDLGYEIWVDNTDALALWDTLMAHGKDYGVHPFGLDTLDICRIEAGFIMAGVDYGAACDALIPSQKSTLYALDLGWTVKLDRPAFIGQAALRREAATGSAQVFVGLEIDWDATEAAFAEVDLPPALPAAAWRRATPLFRGMKQVGHASSGTWSPILKKNLAMGMVDRRLSTPGTVVEIEIMVEHSRRRVPATVTALPFYDPPHKKA